MAAELQNTEIGHCVLAIEDENLKVFSQRLIDQSQCRSRRMFTVGSSTEVRPTIRTLTRFGIKGNQIDLDMMAYTRNIYAFSLLREVPETYHGKVIQIYSVGIPPGFARLIETNDRNEYRLVKNHPIYGFCRSAGVKHGPAWRMDDKIQSKSTTMNTESNENDERFVAETRFDYRIDEMDYVTSIHSPYWPVEASEWVTRSRPHGFPSKSLIGRVASYGCDFVHVSHKLSYNDDSQWRFSFSMAECLIISSWTSEQRIVFRALRLLYKICENSMKFNALCSYCFKTLMLWACEEKEAEFWDKDCFLSSIRVLIIEMLEWLKAKCCPNYFILSNNMIDHITQARLSEDIVALFKLLKVTDSVLWDLVHWCGFDEGYESDKSLHLVLPNWINRAMLVALRVSNTVDSTKDLFRPLDQSPDLQQVVSDELVDIYQGLCYQQKAMGCVSELDKDVYLSEAKRHLETATRYWESSDLEFVDIQVNKKEIEDMLTMYVHDSNFVETRCIAHKPNTKELHPGFVTSFNQWNSFKNSTSNPETDKKYLIYSRNQEFRAHLEHKLSDLQEKMHEMVGKWNTAKSYTKFSVGQKTYTEMYHFKCRNGYSPTVNISWFIAKGYLANLSYAMECDYDAAIKTCDDIIRVFQQSCWNLLFSEHTLPILLTTERASLFYPQLQAVLGFLLLHEFMLNNCCMPGSSSVSFGVCPVLFAHHLKLISFVSGGRWTDAYEQLQKSKKHAEFCQSEMIRNGAEVLEVALGILVRQLSPSRSSRSAASRE